MVTGAHVCVPSLTSLTNTKSWMVTLPTMITGLTNEHKGIGLGYMTHSTPARVPARRARCSDGVLRNVVFWTIAIHKLRFMQLVYNTSGCSSQGFSWSPSDRYLNRSKLASTRLCNNHITQASLLQALHRTVKDGSLPMPASVLWSAHLLPCRRSEWTLDLRASSYKKISKFLQVLQRCIYSSCNLLLAGFNCAVM